MFRMIRIIAPGAPPIAQIKILNIFASILVRPISFVTRNKTRPIIALSANPSADLITLKATIRSTTATIRRIILETIPLVFVR